MAKSGDVRCYVCREELGLNGARGHIRASHHYSLVIGSNQVRCALCANTDVRDLTFTEFSPGIALVLCRHRCGAVVAGRRLPDEHSRAILAEDGEGVDERFGKELKLCSMGDMKIAQKEKCAKIDPDVPKSKKSTISPMKERSVVSGDSFNTWGMESPSSQQDSVSPIVRPPPVTLSPECLPPVSAVTPASQSSDYDEWITPISFIEPEPGLQSVPAEFRNRAEYKAVFINFVEMEEAADRKKKSEYLRDEKCAITWSNGEKVTGELVLKSVKDVYPHDQLSITDSQGHIAHVAIVEIGVDSNPLKISFKGNADSIIKTEGEFELDFLQSMGYFLMRKGLEAFESGIVQDSVAAVIMAQAKPIVDRQEFDVSDLEGLNESQIEAVKHALCSPFALIQGPPGTGKTKTAAAIVFKLHDISQCSVLVCAPSNIAVDQLTLSLSKIPQLEGKVLRIYAKNRIEQGQMTAEEFSLHRKVRVRLAEKYPALKGQLANTKADVKSIISQANLPEKESFLEKMIIASHPIICCTCASSMSAKLPKTFDFVLIDEAGFASEPDSLLPLLRHSSHVVLVGDHKQLPPVVLSRELVALGYAKSMFERLIDANVPSVMLKEQFRMHPGLSAFPSAQFYHGELRNGVTAEDRVMLQFEEFKQKFHADKPLLFFQVSEKEERLEHSFFNPIEIKVVAGVVAELQRLGIPDTSIGIISPYEAQRAKIVECISADANIPWKEIEIKNVDGFQGREKDIMIFSSVRSNMESCIGFMSDSRRLNVAITRGKYGLVMVGNRSVLSTNEDWRKLFDEMDRTKSIRDGNTVLTNPSE